MSGEYTRADVERIREYLDGTEGQGYRAFVEASDALIRVALVVEKALEWAHRYEACSAESGEAELHHAVTALREWRYPRG